MARLKTMELTVSQTNLIMKDRCKMYKLVSKEKIETHRAYFVEKIVIKEVATKDLYYTVASKLLKVKRFNGLKNVDFKEFRPPVKREIKKKK